MSLTILTFGEGYNEGVARVSEITSLLAGSGSDIWFDVSQTVGEATVEKFESARPIHRLRGFAITCEHEKRAPSAEEAAGGYPLLEQLYDGRITTQWYAHLVDHSDDDGYYVPADFVKPLNTFVDGEVASVGSAHRLLAEMNSLEKHMLSAVDACPAEFELEQRAWTVLRDMAKTAVEQGLVIQFKGTNPDFE